MADEKLYNIDTRLKTANDTGSTERDTNERCNINVGVPTSRFSFNEKDNLASLPPKTNQRQVTMFENFFPRHWRSGQIRRSD